MYKNFLCCLIAFSSVIIANAFTIKKGNIYFDNTKAQFQAVTMLCQDNNSHTEVVPMTFDEETGFYKASFSPAFEQYTAIGFVNQEIPDSIVDKKIKDYVEELRVIFSPSPEDPTIENPSTPEEEPSNDNEAPSSEEDTTSGDESTTDEDNINIVEENTSNDNSEEEFPFEGDSSRDDESSSVPPLENGNSSEDVPINETENSNGDENPSETEEPENKFVYLGEISIKLPFETDNVFIPYLSETADICGNWVPLHPERFSPSGQLPILYINTEDGEYLECKSKNLNATFYFEAMGNKDCVSLGSPEEPLTTKIKGRGNSTWRNIAKKPYKLKLAEPASFFGLPESTQWAIMAHSLGALDWIVNASAFYLANNIDFGWHPHLYPIELVLNGNYEGVYFLCETIKISQGRLEIFEQTDMETDPEVIAGGWLVEVDNYEEEGQVKVKEENMTLRVTPHSPEKLSPEQFQWLNDEFSYLTSEIYIPYKDCPIWMEDIDAYDMAKYFIIQEIFDNPDGFNGSFYLHKDLGSNQKWHVGPIWDISCYTRDKNDWTFKMDAGYQFQPHWIGEMLKYHEFLNIVREEFITINEKLTQLYQYNIDYAANVNRGMSANYLRWPTYNTEKPEALANRLNRSLQKNVLHFENKLEEVLSTTALDEIKEPVINEDGNNVIIKLEGNLIKVLSKNNLSDLLIEVFDITGRKIISDHIGNEIFLPYKGVAIIQVTTESSTHTQKLIVR